MNGCSTGILAALALASAGCADPRPPEGPAAASLTCKVALIGWDAATWQVIDPLLRSGDLPNLRGLIERGSRAILTAQSPLYSPVVWTSLATGFPPAEHGVTDFQLPDPTTGRTVLASTLHRRRAPLWQIVSSQDKSAGFVGWWTTWPAEPVRGYIVSDHLAYNRYDDWAERVAGDGYQLTYPPSLAAELVPFRVQPDKIDAATLTALVPFDAREQREMMAADKPLKFHAPSVFRFGYATDASNAQFARHMLDAHPQPDLFAVVFILGDVAGHVFWHHYEPQLFPETQDDLGRLREAIPNVYRQLDRWTGEILARLDPETCVVVLSDHGMGAKRMLPQPEVNAAGDHTPDGILVVAGPALPRGADLGTRSSLDLAPTVLRLMGLPVARDMPGRAIEPLGGAASPAQASWVETYGAGETAVAGETPSPVEQEYLERLKSLGYVK